MTSLLFGEHQLAVGEYVQHAAASQAQLHLLDSGLLLQFAFQAPGLMAYIGSKKTALDFQFHAFSSPLDAVVRSRVVHPLNAECRQLTADC